MRENTAILNKNFCLEILLLYTIKLRADRYCGARDEEIRFGVLRNSSTECLLQDPDVSDLTKDVGNPVAHPSFISSLITDRAQAGALEKCSRRSQ